MEPTGSEESADQQTSQQEEVDAAAFPYRASGSPFDPMRFGALPSLRFRSTPAAPPIEIDQMPDQTVDQNSHATEPTMSQPPTFTSTPGSSTDSDLVTESVEASNIGSSDVIIEPDVGDVAISDSGQASDFEPPVQAEKSSSDEESSSDEALLSDEASSEEDDAVEAEEAAEVELEDEAIDLTEPVTLAAVAGERPNFATGPFNAASMRPPESEATDGNETDVDDDEVAESSDSNDGGAQVINFSDYVGSANKNSADFARSENTEPEMVESEVDESEIAEPGAAKTLATVDVHAEIPAEATPTEANAIEQPVEIDEDLAEDLEADEDVAEDLEGDEPTDVDVEVDDEAVAEVQQTNSDDEAVVEHDADEVESAELEVADEDELAEDRTETDIEAEIVETDAAAEQVVDGDAEVEELVDDEVVAADHDVDEAEFDDLEVENEDDAFEEVLDEIDVEAEVEVIAAEVEADDAVDEDEVSEEPVLEDPAFEDPALEDNAAADELDESEALDEEPPLMMSSYNRGPLLIAASSSASQSEPQSEVDSDEESDQADQLEQTAASQDAVAGQAGAEQDNVVEEEDAEHPVAEDHGDDLDDDDEREDSEADTIELADGSIELADDAIELEPAEDEVSLPSMEDLRTMGLELDEVDAILERLDTDPDALAAELFPEVNEPQRLDLASAD